MADLHSPPQSLTVSLPGALIEELKAVARYKGVSLDDLVREACAAYAEPYVWEQAYVEWRQQHPDAVAIEHGIDGQPLPPARKPA